MKFYSDTLDKLFESEKELKAAEKEHEEAEAKKAEAKALVKQESEKVELAFKARNEARHTYNAKLIELRKTYNQALATAKKAFEDSLAEIEKPLEAAELDYDTKLREFQKAHAEGYRLCLKDGDNVVTLVGNNQVSFPDLTKEFDDLLDLISSALKHW